MYFYIFFDIYYKLACKTIIPNTTLINKTKIDDKINNFSYNNEEENENTYFYINDHNDELTDDDSLNKSKSFKPKDIELFEESCKNQILHLLPNLKIGMDLTKINIPTFMLESRSLLEMYADYMNHPDLFLKYFFNLVNTYYYFI